MDGMVFAIIGGVVVLVLILMVSSYLAAKRRREAIENLAQSLGLEFQPTVSPETMSWLTEVAYFSRGHSHQILNHLSGGTDETEIHILDFHYTIGSGKNASHKRQTVVALVSAALDVPGFDLAPESIFTRFSEWFGVQDIDFESHPEFSDKFMLQATDEDGVRQFMDRPLMDFFCKTSDIYLNVRRGFLCLYRPDKLMAPEQWKDLMGEGFAAYQALVERMAR